MLNSIIVKKYFFSNTGPYFNIYRILYFPNGPLAFYGTTKDV